MKRTCCRATPRCAGCPVVLMARRRMLGAPPDVFAEILSGRPVRPLPESVERALEELQKRPERRYATARKPSLSSADWSDSA